MQTYWVRTVLRGKVPDDPAYTLLSEKMGAAQFSLLPEPENRSKDSPRYSMVDYFFINRNGKADDVLRDAPDVLKKAKAIANSVCEHSIVIVWAGFPEGDGKFSFDIMASFTDDI